VSVFLRWGVFGILGMAALLYAYNTSKHLAENRSAPAAAASQTPPSVSSEVPAEAMPPHCQVEFAVAMRALEARRQGEPVDRLMRMRDITFEESAARRERLSAVAMAWFSRQGEEPSASKLRAAVLSECGEISRAP
jgi:hypothetical protein